MVTFFDLIQNQNPRTQANNPLDALVQAFMSQSELGKSYQQQVQGQKIADIITGKNIPEFAKSEFTPQQLQEQQLNSLMAINPQMAPQIADLIKSQKIASLAGAQADVINNYLYGQQGGGLQPQQPGGMAGQAPQVPGGNPQDMALDNIVNELNRAAMLKNASGGLIDNTAGAQVKADIYKAGATKTSEANAELNSPIRKDARLKVDQSLEELSSLYDQLHNKGAAVEAGEGSGKNISRSIASSGPGQFVNRMRGTEEQSIRNQINKKVPLIINDIRQATGMSAKSMDSNAELQFYLSAISDLSNDYTANKDAIASLSKKYGSGSLAPKDGSKGESKDPKAAAIEELRRRGKM